MPCNEIKLPGNYLVIQQKQQALPIVTSWQTNAYLSVQRRSKKYFCILREYLLSLNYDKNFWKILKVVSLKLKKKFWIYSQNTKNESIYKFYLYSELDNNRDIENFWLNESDLELFLITDIPKSWSEKSQFHQYRNFHAPSFSLSHR